ncbi:hypothetical protein [Acidomonas methanolica]|uniref:Uncharacterized protein n=1 Tax=Acidomonas methanolica NBRC 104435 TaxID=1231351 RepID=A0A023D6E9_ACIMT|nr:hypothetical protein [Acidomonas methanolica]TCS24124.1 hypothetical protein EDC31_12545 [Acidomonas methanolica]GAJ29723.1 hypothetical protein Amme_076_016 [Acidomonas methanolica NBRC 104435]GBQ59481.1 hypothetical protein AA0498_2765 [Acidomonas methanolica]GEL00039.1 hypothetical protein AME01nite_25370 [Acidomonas methanolica NBRC 104435]
MTTPYVSQNPAHTDPRPWSERVDQSAFLPGPASWAEDEPEDEPGEPVPQSSTVAFVLLVCAWVAVWLTIGVGVSIAGGW